MKAASAGKKDTCRLLIDHGADINVRNNEGKSALDIAEYYQQKDIITLLIACGAKPENGEPTDLEDEEPER